ncbi:hypothetical protein D3C77_667320 [compost metagenome]
MRVKWGRVRGAGSEGAKDVVIVMPGAGLCLQRISLCSGVHIKHGRRAGSKGAGGAIFPFWWGLPSLLSQK